jgi:tRNA(Ile)-lysidine synthase
MREPASPLASLLARLPPRRRLLVAYSGGLDSTLLLHEAVQHARADSLELLAVHVHHGLSRHADAWAAHAAAHCARLGVPLQVVHVTVRRDVPSLEQAAREARHAALAGLLRPGDGLLLAHHADDQAETLLLRLLRGSGLAGLGAMRPWRPVAGPADALLLRPLLALSRADIEARARAAGLDWIEDDSNLDTTFDRNYLRGEVMPLLQARWPGAAAVLARDAALLGEAAAVLDTFLDDELAGLCDARGALDAAGLLAREPARRALLLRRWLLRCGAPVPAAARLEDLLALAAARPDAEGHLDWAGWELHRFRGRLQAFARLPALSPLAVDWDLTGRLPLGEGGGELVAEPWQPDRPGLALGLPAGTAVRVGRRSGGERFRPAGDDHTRELKKWLQARGVPPWWRQRLPLLFTPGGELLAVADLAAAQPAAGPPQVLLRWEHRLPGAG